jgi:hypothetical protein
MDINAGVIPASRRAFGESESSLLSVSRVFLNTGSAAGWRYVIAVPPRAHCPQYGACRGNLKILNKLIQAWRLWNKSAPIAQ